MGVLAGWTRDLARWMPGTALLASPASGAGSAPPVAGALSARAAVGRRLVAALPVSGPQSRATSHDPARALAASVSRVVR